MECSYCENRCDIGDGNHGICAMYSLGDYGIVPRYKNQVSSITIGRIEDVPVMHYYPGSLTLLMGTVGCNFDCRYCQNSPVARIYDKDHFRYELSPQQLVNKAAANGCQNIAFTVNEPVVSFPYFIEMAAEAKKAGLRVGCATNAYFTGSSARIVAEHIDFVNISLKALSDRFYRDYCQVDTVAPVLRNLRFLYESGVHVEVTTPIVPDMDDAEAEEIARTLGAISRDIPWHIFWLVPEYKMAEGEHISVERLKSIREKAGAYLNYAFIGNMVGSEWLDTCCPECGAPLIKRIDALGCGSQLTDYRLVDGKCPDCGADIPVVGKYSLSFADADVTTCPVVPVSGSGEGLYGLLDVHGHQKYIDMRTGEKTTARSPVLSQISEIISKEPYPGDEKPESDTWVTDIALKLCDTYRPDLVVLDYAQACFVSVSFPERKDEAYENTFANISRFLECTEYVPLVFGCGNLETVIQQVDLEGMLNTREEFLTTLFKHAYISKEVIADSSSDQLAALREVATLVEKKEFLESLSKGYCQEYAETLGDYIAIARPGIVFKGLNSQYRTSRLTVAQDKWVPVHTGLDTCPEDITQVAPVVVEAVRNGKKVAFIIVEGAGFDNFPLPARKCRNYDGHYTYQMHQQYITLGTGVPYTRSPFQFPVGQHFWLQDYRPYPFSGRFHRVLENTLRHQIGDRKSISVGNRNILTHVCLEADISLECYCCYQHNFGTMVVFNDKILV
ncbi:MAG: radical SAM protein [Dehalococcoidales bacterium]|nr:radical SAM protein [Dehalococcoidales bacterium]